MSAPLGWFVLIEETDTRDYEFVVAKTIPVDGGAKEAWEAALDVARTHERPGSRSDCVREIYRLSERSLRVVLRATESTFIWESFRVSFAELLEVHEPLEPPQDEETTEKGSRLWRRRRT